ncbi:MAG: hypothetical protein GC179_14170 [Anaerolineaceae bacterium]|nr:hypothetical protein [Anaerolineaceae bacterium]
MTTNVASLKVPTRRKPIIRRQTRYMLLLYGALALLLSLVVIAQTASAYRTAYDLFQGIAVVNSTKVDAAEEALQRLANTSQATADYTALTSDTPLYEQAQNDIFRNFQRYRDQMFVLQSNLQSEDEKAAFTVADTYTYSRFWRHVGNLMAQRSDLTAARQEYLFADAQLRTRIIPALQQLEALNFDAMVAAGQRAGTEISQQVYLLAVFGILLAVGLTVLSFWLRGKVRRILTPGIDIALILGWLLILVMVFNLLALPTQLTQMTNDAYFSISGVSRVLVQANQANRAESSAVIDSDRKADWYKQFDDAVESIQLRICGQPDCMQQTFTAPNRLSINSQAVAGAQTISDANEAIIDNIRPLLAHLTYGDEVLALEKARLAFVDYLKVNAQLREKIDAGDTTGAVELNTGTADGSSEEAFNRFVNAIDEVRTVNQQVFDDIWNTQREDLPRNQVLYGVAGYLILMGLVVAGVVHRFREL